MRGPQPRRRRRSPPASRPASGRRPRRRRGRSERAARGARRPMMIWPSPPTLVSPARAGTATARAPRTIGAIWMRICSTERERRKVDTHMSPYTSSGFAPLVISRTLKITRAAVNAATQRTTTGSDRWRRPGCGRRHVERRVCQGGHAAPPSISRPMPAGRSRPRAISPEMCPSCSTTIRSAMPSARRGPRETMRTPAPASRALEQELLRAAHVGDVEAPARVGGDDQRRVERRAPGSE